MNNRKTPFSYRAFVSILMAICFLGLAISGIVMYIAPPCSVAEATGWMFTGITKVQWSSLHQVMALIIVVLALFHLFIYNWKPFLCYFRGRKARSLSKNKLKDSSSLQSKVPREVYFATLAAIILYAGALTLIPPFGWLHDGQDLIKDSHRESVERTGRGLGGGGGGQQLEAQRHLQFDTLATDRLIPEGLETQCPDTEELIDIHDQQLLDDCGLGRTEEQRGGGGLGQGEPEGRGLGQGGGQGEGRGLGQGDPQGRGMGVGQGDGRGFGQDDSLKQGDVHR